MLPWFCSCALAFLQSFFNMGCFALCAFVLNAKRNNCYCSSYFLHLYQRLWGSLQLLFLFNFLIISFCSTAAPSWISSFCSIWLVVCCRNQLRSTAALLCYDMGWKPCTYRLRFFYIPRKHKNRGLPNFWLLSTKTYQSRHRARMKY